MALVGAALDPAFNLQQVFIGHDVGGQRQVDQHQKPVAIGVQREHLEFVAGRQHPRTDQGLAHHREQLLPTQDAPATARRDQRQGGLAEGTARLRTATVGTRI
ncbi:hypothetical protein D9M70_619980 [compost metagenome]